MTAWFFSFIYSLQDTYPRYPPIWFSDSEDPILTRIFDQLRLTDAVNFTVGFVFALSVSFYHAFSSIHFVFLCSFCNVLPDFARCFFCPQVDRQVKMLVIQLCRYKHIDCPPELERLCPDFDPQLVSLFMRSILLHIVNFDV